mgnify:CR=1 FL=1
MGNWRAVLSWQEMDSTKLLPGTTKDLKQILTHMNVINSSLEKTLSVIADNLESVVALVEKHSTELKTLPDSAVVDKFINDMKNLALKIKDEDFTEFDIFDLTDIPSDIEMFLEELGVLDMFYNRIVPRN